MILQAILLSVFFLAAVPLFGQGAGRAEAKHVAKDSPATADPSSALWKKIKPMIVTTDRYGKPVNGHRTEIRTAWSESFLYVLYTCPYEKLHLMANPTTAHETDKLWDYDVAELFIGTDFQNINLYKEFEISPQGEWVDLDVDHAHMKIGPAMAWNSGIEVKSRIDKEKKIWYGEMKIPMRSISDKPVKPGTEMRINYYRIQGPPPERVYMAWNPINANSYHTPEKFGVIKFVK